MTCCIVDVVVGSEGDIKPAIEIHEMLYIVDVVVDVVVGSEGDIKPAIEIHEMYRGCCCRF